MHKDELLQLHSLLCQMKRFFEEAGVAGDESFRSYQDLEVSPQHIHKSKTDHKRAVFLLAQGFSNVVMVGNAENRDRLVERFERLAAEEVEEPVVSQDRGNRDSHLPAFALAALGQ